MLHFVSSGLFFFSDALNMSKDVHAALTDVIAQYLKDKGAGLYALFCDSKLSVMSYVHSQFSCYCLLLGWLVMQTSHFSTVHCKHCN